MFFSGGQESLLTAGLLQRKENSCHPKVYCLQTTREKWHMHAALIFVLLCLLPSCSMLPLTDLWSLLRAENVPIRFWWQKFQWHPVTILREPKVISVSLVSSWILFWVLSWGSVSGCTGYWRSLYSGTFFITWSQSWSHLETRELYT